MIHVPVTGVNHRLKFCFSVPFSLYIISESERKRMMWKSADFGEVAADHFIFCRWRWLTNNFDKKTVMGSDMHIAHDSISLKNEKKLSFHLLSQKTGMSKSDSMRHGRVSDFKYNLLGGVHRLWRCNEIWRKRTDSYRTSCRLRLSWL